VYRPPGEDDKLTLYIQAVHMDQQKAWITDVKKGRHVFQQRHPPGWAGARKVKQIWILLKQETVSGSGIRHA